MAVRVYLLFEIDFERDDDSRFALVPRIVHGSTRENGLFALAIHRI
jgi:hypothetical protein